MVVEDEKLLLKAIEKKLSISGFETVGFKSGEDCLEYLKQNQKRPDLIWLDYYLKDTNALEIMNKMKTEPFCKLCKDIPVFIVSNSASDEKVHNLLRLGASKYLLKAEHKIEDIIKEINKAIK